VGSADDVADHLHAGGATDARSVGQAKGPIFSFVKEIEEDDLVLVPLKTQNGLVAVGRVTGGYHYNPTGPLDARHERPVEWLRTDVPRENFGDLQPKLGERPTVFRVGGNDTEHLVRQMLGSWQPIVLTSGNAARVRQLLGEVLEVLAVEEPDANHLRELITNIGPQRLQLLLESDLQITGSVGIGTAAQVPWILLTLASKEASAQSGFYIVYLFAADGSAVYLSVIQGTENVRGGTPPLRKRALDLRQAAGLRGNPETIDLRSTATRPRKYEAGSAAAVRYERGALPSPDALEADLQRFLAHLRTAASSGLLFDPEIEPLHLVLKWSSDRESSTIERSAAVVDREGSVWWGRWGMGGSAISASRLEQIREQVRRGVPTYAFLYGGGGMTRATLQEITLGIHRYGCRGWHLPDGETPSHGVASDRGGRPACGCQAGQVARKRPGGPDDDRSEWPYGDLSPWRRAALAIRARAGPSERTRPALVSRSSRR